MSIRRIVQIVAFISALAFAFASPIASSSAAASGCDPHGSAGFC